MLLCLPWLDLCGRNEFCCHDLWELVPTPAKARRIREATVAKVLKRNRIRRFDAAHFLDVLRKPPLEVAAGAHIASLIARIRLVDRQLKEAYRQLDALSSSQAAPRSLSRPSMVGK